MGFFAKYNTRNIEWGIDTTDFQFVKLSSFKKDDIINIRGFFTIKDNLNGGLQAIAITDNCLVNLPKNKVEIVTDILSDNTAIEEIKKGNCFIKVTKYLDKKHGPEKECSSFEFVDTGF